MICGGKEILTGNEKAPITENRTDMSMIENQQLRYNQQFIPQKRIYACFRDGTNKSSVDN